MADEGRGITRWIRLILDRDSAKKAAADMESAMARAGEVGGQAFLRELRQEFDQKMAELRAKLSQGLISPTQFRQQADIAARAFNQKLGAAITKLRNEGKLTDQEFQRLGRRFKRTADTGVSAFGKLKALLGTLGIALGLRQGLRLFDEFIGRGGQVANVTAAFTQRVGDQRGAILQLRSAARGLINDYDLMVAANQALTLGSAKSVDEVAQLVSISQKLGRALGIDASYALTSLNTGIARQSRLYLDNVGIIIDVEAENKKYAAQLNKQVKDLTDLEKREVFRTAAIRKAQEAIDAMGQSTLNAADAWERIKINAGNALDNIRNKIASSPAVQDFFRSLVARTSQSLTPSDVLGGLNFLNPRAVSQRLRQVNERLALIRPEGQTIGPTMSGEVLALRKEYQALLPVQEKLLTLLHRLNEGRTMEAEGTEEVVGLTEEQQKAVDKLNLSLTTTDQLHMVFGSTVDVVTEKQDAYRQAIGSLIREGLTPQSALVQQLVRDLNDVQRQYLLSAAAAQDFRQAAGQDQRPGEIANRASRPRIGVGPRDRSGGLTPFSSLGLLPSEQFEKDVEKVRNSMGLIEDSAQVAAFNVASAWSNAFGLMISDAEGAGQVIVGIAGGIAGGLLQGLASYAGGKIAENVALVFEEHAKGVAAAANPFLSWTAPAHFAAAKAHGVAALKWAAFGAIAGGAAGAISRGGGGGGGGASIPTGATFQGDRQQPPPEVHVYVDGFDPDNPSHVRLLARGVANVEEQWAGQKPTVRVHTRTAQARL